MELVEGRFLFAFPPRALKVGNLLPCSAAIEEELVGRLEPFKALLVTVEAAKFRVSLLCRFPMASGAWVAMAHADEMCLTSPGGGNFHMKVTGMFVGKLELTP